MGRAVRDASTCRSPDAAVGGQRGRALPRLMGVPELSGSATARPRSHRALNGSREEGGRASASRGRRHFGPPSSPCAEEDRAGRRSSDGGPALSKLEAMTDVCSGARHDRRPGRPPTRDLAGPDRPGRVASASSPNKTTAVGSPVPAMPPAERTARVFGGLLRRDGDHPHPARAAGTALSATGAASGALSQPAELMRKARRDAYPLVAHDPLGGRSRGHFVLYANRCGRPPARRIRGRPGGREPEPSTGRAVGCPISGRSTFAARPARGTAGGCEQLGPRGPPVNGATIAEQVSVRWNAHGRGGTRARRRGSPRRPASP